MAKSYTPGPNDLVYPDGKILVNGKLPEKRVKVKIPKIPGAKVQEDVVLTINGETIIIQRGVEVEIPANFAALLKDMEAAREDADKFYFENASE